MSDESPSKQWMVLDGHVMPLDDLRGHDYNLNCWCQPTPEPDMPQVIVHHAMDKREEYEQGKKYD